MFTNKTSRREIFFDPRNVHIIDKNLLTTLKLFCNNMYGRMAAETPCGSCEHCLKNTDSEHNKEGFELDFYIPLHYNNEDIFLIPNHILIYFPPKDDICGYFNVYDENEKFHGQLFEEDNDKVYSYKQYVELNFNKTFNTEQNMIFWKFIEENVKIGITNLAKGKYDFTFQNKEIVIALYNDFKFIEYDFNINATATDCIDIVQFLEKNTMQGVKYLLQKLNIHRQSENNFCFITLKNDLVLKKSDNDELAYSLMNTISIPENFDLNEKDNKIFSDFLNDRLIKKQWIIKAGEHLFNENKLILSKTLVTYPAKKEPVSIKYAILPQKAFKKGGSSECFISTSTLFKNGNKFYENKKTKNKQRVIKFLVIGIEKYINGFRYEHEKLKEMGDNHVKEIAYNYDNKKNPSDAAIIMKLHHGENLHDYLQKDKENKFNNMDIDKRLKLIINIYKAYSNDFAKKGLLHGDLKPENIIVDGDNIIFIDFASARKHDYVNDNSYGIKPTNFFTKNFAPFEVLKNSQYSLESDLFSLGIIAREILGFWIQDIQIPKYPQQPNAYDVIKKIRVTDILYPNYANNFLDDLNEFQKHDVEKNLKSNYSFEPKDRPSLQETIEVYQTVLNNRINVVDRDNNNKQKQKDEESSSNKRHKFN